MRYLVVLAIGLMAVSAPAAEDTRAVTVLLDFRGEASPGSVNALQNELTKLIRPAGVEFGYRVASELGPGPEPTDIIVVKFSGKCRRDALAPAVEREGPLAFTHVSNGEILPFAEVACDRVQSSIRSKLANAVSDEVLGRALARVVAHEMYHILARTPHHGGEGVARRALSSRDLIAENMRFSEPDLRKFMTR